MPPRIVVRRPGSSETSSFLITAVFLTVGLVFAGIFCVAEPLFLLLAPAYPGHIIGTEWHDTSGTHAHRVYTIGFVYTRDGTQFIDSQEVSHRRYQSAHAGDPVQIPFISAGQWHFDELDMTSGDYVGTRWDLWLWAAFWNGGTLLILHTELLVPRRLIRDGRPAIGQISAKQKVRGKSSTCYLKYTYQPEGGEPLTRQMAVNRNVYEQAVENTDVVILYDPNRPKRSLIYQYCPYRAL